MTEVQEAITSSPEDLLATGRRHLAVKDYNAATEALAKACELLAKAHGDTADECAEAYLWYGKALLGLSREENGVLGEAVPGTNNEDGDENEDEEEEQQQAANKDGEEVEKIEAESTTKDDEPVTSAADDVEEKPSTSNGDANDESLMNLDGEDDVDNLQLAWEMLELSRGILQKRSESGGEAARALLADVRLALGEVALESETYDKAIEDMVSCLEIQKELYKSDDRRIAETHYQIGLANFLASDFEEAITHFKNAANILESRIKTLENPTAVAEDTTVKKYTNSDPLYTVESELKELKDLLPEIQEKIQDMMDYKAEIVKRVRELQNPSSAGSQSNGAGSSKTEAKPAPSNISHLIKRKRKNSEEEASPAKRVNT